MKFRNGKLMDGGRADGTFAEDNVRPFDAVSERDIHAYVDGQLDEDRRRKVEAHLERHPELADAVRDDIEINRLLRRACAPIAEEPVPPRLLAALARPARREWPAAARAAAVAALCVVSAGTGWIAARQGLPAQDRGDVLEAFLRQAAISAGRTAEAPQVKTLDIAGNGPADPLNWLTQTIALEMRAPDLSAAGYSLERRRLVTAGTLKFVELTYSGGDGQPLKLYLKTRWDKEPPGLEFAQQDGQSIAYWQEGPLVYALTGALDEARAARIAGLVRDAMTDGPQEAPRAPGGMAGAQPAPAPAPSAPDQGIPVAPQPPVAVPQPGGEAPARPAVAH